MLGGWNRNVRAKNYMRHLEAHYGRRVHTLLEVPNTGHQTEKLMLEALNELHYLSVEEVKDGPLVSSSSFLDT